MRPVVLALLAIVATSCSSEQGGDDAEPRCPAIADQAVTERITKVARDVVEHRARAIVSEAEGTASLILSDNAIRISPEAAKVEDRAYQVLSWWYGSDRYVRFEVSDVRTGQVSACGNRMVAEVTLGLDLVGTGGRYTTKQAPGPIEFEFDTTGGQWTLKGHRLVGVVKQRPMIEPEDSMYERYDKR